jgi:hypothetical protein
VFGEVRLFLAELPGTPTGNPLWAELDYHSNPTGHPGWQLTAFQSNEEREEHMQKQASAGTTVEKNLMAALFTETQSVRDAVADLREAGFGADHIYVAFSAEHDRFDPKHSELWQIGGHGVFRGEHSVPWKLRHSFERDLHHRTGAGPRSEELSGEGGQHDALCTEVNLHDALQSIGVAEDRIRLVNQQVGDHGALIIVECSCYGKKAKSILERNCGQIRTDTATECPPGSWRRV